jgi:hypothetical protein
MCMLPRNINGSKNIALHSPLRLSSQQSGPRIKRVDKCNIPVSLTSSYERSV